VIASSGGLVGLILHAPFLDLTGEATLEDAVSHIVHMRDVMGIDHVGIGSDFDGLTQPVEGLEDPTRFPELAAALLRAGLTDQDVRDVMGENAVRLLGTLPRAGAGAHDTATP
jgi:membrane dipeptidase